MQNPEVTGRYMYIDKTDIEKTFKRVNDRYSFYSARHIWFPSTAINRIHRTCLPSYRPICSVFCNINRIIKHTRLKKYLCKLVYKIYIFKLTIFWDCSIITLNKKIAHINKIDKSIWLFNGENQIKKETIQVLSVNSISLFEDLFQFYL